MNLKTIKNTLRLNYFIEKNISTVSTVKYALNYITTLYPLTNNCVIWEQKISFNKKQFHNYSCQNKITINKLLQNIIT